MRRTLWRKSSGPEKSWKTIITRCSLGIACVVLSLGVLYPGSFASANPAPLAAGTVVLADPAGAYYPLAEEIARVESLPIAPDLATALAYQPAAILWVSTPAQLTDQALAEAGRLLKTYASLPAVGLFTGDTLEQARQLWQRGALLRSDVLAARQVYAANAQYPTARIETARLMAFAEQPAQESELNKKTLAAALHTADYLSFTGHGSAGYLRLDEHTQFMAGDVPGLSSIVVSTASCQTFRLWKDGSIALAFARQGAAAYAGFVFSPLEGYLIGEFNHLPLRYSWPEFPIGMVAALQNRGTLQGFAGFPHYFILGDPRLALQPAAPYTLIQDEQQGEMRILKYGGAPAGLIPVRVPDAAGYHFVEVVGLSTAADGDPFFNARLQVASLQGDKFILFTHNGGDFTLRLHKAPPWYRTLTHSLLNALDHVALFTPMNGGGVIVAGTGTVLLAALGIWLWRRPRPGAVVRRAGLLSTGAGLGLTFLLGLYQVVRLPHVEITTKPLVFEPVWLLGVFLLTTGSTLLYLLARSRRARFLAVLAAASPAWLPAVFSLVAISGMNLLIAAQLETGIYNANLGWLPLIAAGVWAPGIWLIFAGVRRLDASTGAAQEHELATIS